MKNKIIYGLLGIIGLYLVLMIPDGSETEIQRAGNATPFLWDQDQRWEQLEEQFASARSESDESLEIRIDLISAGLNNQLDQLQQDGFTPDDPRLDPFLNDFFELAPLVAAQENQNEGFFSIYNRARRLIKDQSENWDTDNPQTRITLYKLLYGMRAAVEEVNLQSQQHIYPVLHVEDEPSATPSTNILGIRVHSGDLLVSRGGAEVSALISRGNDFPGNFSHVALIYIEEGTNIPYLVEAHIERGVAIANLEEYIRDRKLRFMVLRPRADLPELRSDPMLPHKAAKMMYEEVQERHIPYDFKMDFFDPEAMFCSEVGSYAYKEYGIRLWQTESTISSDGVVRLLNTFGVENFVTQMPSDLEYDPQLAVVAEWRDAESLFDDHLYSAVIDAMLMCADKGEQVDYTIWMLPIARAVKAWSVLKNWLGGEGPVPERMSATQALKNNSFVDRHREIKEEVSSKALRFEKEKGYVPPYWELVKMAEESANCKES